MLWEYCITQYVIKGGIEMAKLKINTPILRYYMELKGWNLSALALNAAVSRNTVSALFANKDVSMNTIQKIISALEIPTEKAGEIFFADKLRGT